MTKREYNCKIAKENKEIIESDGYLNHEFVVDFDYEPEAHENVIVIRPEDHDLYVEKIKDEEERMYITNNCRIKVVNASSFDVCSDLVLNFANARHPGGGYKTGADSQEEMLCRQSTLYSSLSSEKASEMYAYNFEHRHPMESDYMLLSPTVEVFRDNEMNLQHETSTFAVLTVPAPNLNGRAQNVPEQEVDVYMMNRIRMMLTVSNQYGYKNLTLGAWGCGAFGHDAMKVADYFKKILYEEMFCVLFDSITFAVYDDTPNRYNYISFDHILGHNQSMIRPETIVSKYKMPCLGIHTKDAVPGEDYGYSQGIMENGIPFIAEVYYFEGTESEEIHLIIPAECVKSFQWQNCIQKELEEEPDYLWSSVICKDVKDFHVVHDSACIDELLQIVYHNRIVEKTDKLCCYCACGKDLSENELVLFSMYLHDEREDYTNILIPFYSFVDEGREFRLEKINISSDLDE